MIGPCVHEVHRLSPFRRIGADDSELPCALHARPNWRCARRWRRQGGGRVRRVALRIRLFATPGPCRGWRAPEPRAAGSVWIRPCERLEAAPFHARRPSTADGATSQRCLPPRPRPAGGLATTGTAMGSADARACSDPRRGTTALTVVGGRPNPACARRAPCLERLDRFGGASARPREPGSARLHAKPGRTAGPGPCWGAEPAPSAAGSVGASTSRGPARRRPRPRRPSWRSHAVTARLGPPLRAKRRRAGGERPPARRRHAMRRPNP